MTREHEIFKQAGLLSLLGFFLFALVFCSPDVGWYQHASFFTIARHANWRHAFDLSTAWCSLKIILFSVGLFFSIESVGTVLALMKYKTLALAVFLTQVVSAAGILFGTFCLFKSLI